MKKTLIFVLVLVPFLTAHADLITLPNEPDVCSNIEGHQYPAPEGYHAEVDGTCTLLEEPVTIDIVPPGGEPQTIDVTPPGDDSKTIDVNPSSTSSVGGSSGGRRRTITDINEVMGSVLGASTSVSEQTVLTLQIQLIGLLTQMVQQLQAQLNTP